MVWPDPLATWSNVDEYPNAEAKESAWKLFERVSKLDLNEALKIGAKQDKYDPLPYLRFDQNGLKEFNGWRAKHEASIRSDELSPALEGHIAKYRKLVPALALINHVADEYGTGAISQQSVLRALAFTKYLESHARRVYGAGILAEVAAAKAVLRRIKGGDLADGFSAREIQRKDWSHLTESHHIAAGLDLLADHNYVAVQDRPIGQKGGRPSTAYLINPAVKPKNKNGAA
jgi:putative DNA primase/helicase